jgi:hypothetical protein
LNSLPISPYTFLLPSSASSTSDSCIDENGKAVHEDCYARSLAERNSSPNPKVA